MRLKWVADWGLYWFHPAFLVLPVVWRYNVVLCVYAAECPIALYSIIFDLRVSWLVDGWNDRLFWHMP